MSKLNRYWLITFAATLAACFYPIYMGFAVIYDMLTLGAVLAEDFPKYVIPYTPIAIAVIVAVAVMPLIFKLFRRFYTLVATVVSLIIFFISELLFEGQILVDSGIIDTELEVWQMLSCYVDPSRFETRKWTAIDVIIGDYSPTFKLHFYLISVILILAIIGIIYGFAKLIKSGDKAKLKSLVIQSVCTFIFLGLCILACFTAFFRGGELNISPLSAFLMGCFFVIMGVTSGIYSGSFLLKKGKLAIIIPSAISFAVTTLMYVGETFLLSGNLYVLGKGFLFESLPGIILAPIDILIILLSTVITVIICRFLNIEKEL